MIFKKEYVICPICKSKKCIREYDYITCSEKIECCNCKHKIQFTYIKDKKGKVIKLNDNRELAVENLISKEFLLKIPCGILINQHFDGEIIGNAIKSVIDQYKTLLKSNVLDGVHVMV